MRTRISEVIAKPFHAIHNDIKQNKHTHYWLKGGRGSTKSSFISIEIILGLLKDPNGNAVIFRKVAGELRTSVFSQMMWAIDKLGLNDYFDCTVNPLRITYKPTKQMILFRGLDNPRKIKSIKFQQGYCKFLWFEEVDEFQGMEEIRMVTQSLVRGGTDFKLFYSFNPPKSARNWVNGEILDHRNDRIVHHGTYLDVPKEWLGEQFFVEAEHLKNTKPDKYQHEYMGEVIGTGGEIFTNIKEQALTQDEINKFDNLKYGADFGYSVDPFVWLAMHYDRKYKRLYIFDEIYKVGLSNRAAADLIKFKGKGWKPIYFDSAEPKSIAEIKEYGIMAYGAIKGADSIDYGIKFLQDLEQIIIDSNRCPNAYREFIGYEYLPDGNDGFKALYPDKNNHAIDAARYGLSQDMNIKGKIKVY